MQGAGWTGRIGAPIVRRENKDGVAELAEIFEQRDQPADILVGAVEHRGVSLHVAQEEMPLLRRDLLPGGHGRVTLGQPGAFRDQPHCQLALEPLGANDVPAGLVTAAIFRQIRSLGLQWPVHGIIGDVEKERAGRVLVADLGDKPDRLVHPVVGRVITGRILVDRRHDVVVDDAGREEVTGLAFEKPIETVETAIGRPGRVGRNTVR
jgi:hypothetical protein